MKLRGLRAIMLTALLGLAVVGLSQCRMVEDTVTGVELNASGTLSARSKCKKECDKAYKADKKAEDERHKAAEKACGKDKVCKKNEKERNKDNKEDIKDRKEDCQRNCYNEGSIGGGR